MKKGYKFRALAFSSAFSLIFTGCASKENIQQSSSEEFL